MFVAAIDVAKEFTRPIIISQRNTKGECSSGIGACVIINEEGWFATALHVLQMFEDLKKSNIEHTQIMEQRKKIEENTGMKKHHQINALKKLPINPASATNCSIWIGADGVYYEEAFGIVDIDLAIGKLVNFDKNSIKVYPKFKDPSKPMSIGTSLCKLGYPFFSIIPSFDEATSNFMLPNGTVPPPLFPMEGILTRTVQLQPMPPAPPYQYPMKYIETSSPGLRGQSGGPIFDVHGAIWAIQSKTQHLPLGFGDAKNTGKEAEHLRHQYLNVGWGIHSETIFALFKERNINHQITDY